MIVKYTIAGVTGAALLASAAFAQSPATSDSTIKNSPTTTMSNTSTPSTAQSGWRASKLVGLSVYNDANESVGSINDLLTDKNGKITAVVIGVGGFLGVGEHLVAVPFEKVKFVDQPVTYTGASNAPAKPASSTTTGAATTTAPAASSKSNPWYPDHAVFNATKDELKAMPEFKYST
jgi:sporulation protein YlmC with PRC-barrel domain